jgi:hypothetical protein
MTSYRVNEAQRRYNPIHSQLKKAGWNLFIALALTTLNACATVPRESVDLSIELTKMIRSAEKSHLVILDLFIAERKQRADEFLKNTWVPKFMSKTVVNTHFLDSLKARRSDEQKTALLKEFSEDAVLTISERRESMMDAIDKIGKLLRDKIKDHYADMLTVSEALTAHIRSAADATETRTMLLNALKVDPKSLLPFDKMAGVLDKVTGFQGEVKEIGAYVEEAKTIMKGEQ